MRRRLLAALLFVVAVAAIYELALRDTTVAPKLTLARPTATIGTGSTAVGVGPNGTILDWLPIPEDAALPRLPLSSLPPGTSRLGGPMLQQARVLGAAPAALRPYLESSFYGESGVDVMLRSGIELRFGDVSNAAEKWRAAATVLADPSISALDYVDLHAPQHPATGGVGHLLPTLP